MLLLSTIAAGALAGCSIWKRDIGGTVLKSDQARTELTLEEAPDPNAAVSACDALGAALLSAQLADGAHANALASPASLALNLAAASLGATDPEAQGLNKLLGAADEEARNTTWSAIQTALLAHDGDVSGFKPDEKAPEHPLVHVADQIVIIDHDEPTEVSQDFIDNVRYWFSADLRRADVDKAQDVLNEWVKQNTGGLIESSALDATTIDLALQNVVLFAAQWKELFDKKSTQDEDFTCADGSVKSVSMMTQNQMKNMVCTEGSTGSVTWKALRLPYSEDFALDIVLPDKGALPEDMPGDTWAAASALLDEAESEGSSAVNLWLPSIDLATPDGGIDVLPVLETLGADIRPMERVSPYFETRDYRQQVRLIVHEAGTTAAASSEDGMVFASGVSNVTDFHVDHPYVMRLRDLSTGIALFEAIINNPS